MNYKGYEVTEKDNGIIVGNVRDFDLVHIFQCGQCFRWIKQQDGSFTGVVRDKVVNVRMEDGKLIMHNATSEDFQSLWYDYFDLGRDYGEIKKQLMKDEIMEKAVKFGYGIRLLKQDIWETVVSFIISANNRIPMIMKTVAAICKAYGKELKMDGDSYYTFPDSRLLENSGLERLQLCGGGFRCKYIVNTSRMVNSGEIDLAALTGMTAGEAREELVRFPGVGNKVADCTLLFSGTKYDVFPTDVWVKRVMEVLYFKREAGFKEIQDFASEYFGEFSGFAQQYLFYYARELRIGAK